MAMLWLAALAAMSLALDACTPTAGSPGQAATRSWNPLAPYRPGLVRIGPGGGPVLSDVPGYGSPVKQPAPTLPAAYTSLMQLCKDHYSPQQQTNVAYRIQTARQMDTYPEYEVAFAGIPIVPEFRGGHSNGFTTETAATGYADCIADARGELGDYLFFRERDCPRLR